MAKTESARLPLGVEAPDFSLRDCDGETVRLRDFDDAPVLVVAFICNHCPFVKHVAAELAAFGREAMDHGVAIVAINANDADAYPDDSPVRMREEKARRGYPFPYLHDESQEIARAYGATCTPDFFVFDGDRRLAYHGRFDQSSPGRHDPVTGEELRDAVEALLKAHDVPEEQFPSVGCGIKWRAGH